MEVTQEAIRGALLGLCLALVLCLIILDSLRKK